MFLVEVRFHQGRYLGRRDWPPSPARLFQALVAGAAVGEAISETARSALLWLERQAPPEVFAPASVLGRQVIEYVPNNDLDGEKTRGDPERVAQIRVPKELCAHLFDADKPFLYAWRVPEKDVPIQALEDLALGLYRLGLGQDAAWASARVVSEAELRALSPSLEAHRPTPGAADGHPLTCPRRGTLDSINARHRALVRTLQHVGTGRSASEIYRQAPRPFLQQITYGGSAVHHLFELRCRRGFHAWPGHRPAPLVELVRDGVEGRLGETSPKTMSLCRRYLSGRERGGGPELRVQLIPLPSIGHDDVDPSIRRLLVRVPCACPLPSGDLIWALGLIKPAEGATLDPAEDLSFAHHYGLGGPPSHEWRTVTPVVLPRPRRRVPPDGTVPKSGVERLEEHRTAEHQLRDALRHAGIRAALSQVEVRREPWQRRGHMAECFADETRFDKARLWHVRAVFREPISGPLVLGDGRFLGLGLFAPYRQNARLVAVPVLDGLGEGAAPRVSPERCDEPC